MATPALPRFWFESIRIQGYRPFNDFSASLSPLEVFVGANGVGKSSLFEFLRFLKYAMDEEIPPEVVKGAIGQQVFHKPGPDRFAWELGVSERKFNLSLRYAVELLGPLGRIRIERETVEVANNEVRLLELMAGEGEITKFGSNDDSRKKITVAQPDRLALSTINARDSTLLASLKDEIASTSFYDSSSINKQAIRLGVPVQQRPSLREDCSNLSAVLFYLMTEHPDRFKTLQGILRLAISDFKRLAVKARGGPGEVIAFYEQQYQPAELTLADLSDGTLRLLIWAALCYLPNPGIVCIDEPDQGLHPRALPVLAEMFRKASAHRQFLISTHSSYFLRQFNLSEIAIIRKENGEPKFVKPSDSKVLRENLEDFGQDEIERMHRSEELEQLA